MPAGKIVTVVTGGSSGIGAAVCRALAGPDSAILVHAGHNGEKAERMAAELRDSGTEAAVAVADFGVPDRAGSLVESALARWGRVDRLVHAAGFADRTAFGELDAEGLARSFQANAYAFFHLVTAALPLLPRDGSGRVVAISSFLAHRSRMTPGLLFPATSASKAALEGFVRALAVQLAPDAITVNAVVPGFIEKDAGQHAAVRAEARVALEGLIPFGRYGSAEEVAKVTAFLLSRGASYVTGQSIGVDGGLTL